MIELVKDFPAGKGEFAVRLPDGGIGVVHVEAFPDAVNRRIRARAWKAEPDGRRSVTPRGTAIMLPERWRVVPRGLRDEDAFVNEVTDVVRKMYDELVAHIAALNAVASAAADLMGEKV